MESFAAGLTDANLTIIGDNDAVTSIDTQFAHLVPTLRNIAQGGFPGWKSGRVESSDPTITPLVDDSIFNKRGDCIPPGPARAQSVDITLLR